MKKYCLILILLASIFLLSSCSLGGSRNMIVDDSHKIADTRLEQILDAISNKEKDTMKTMFSKQVLSEASDFDENLETLFNYVQGDIKSWKSTGAYTFPEEKNADGTGNHKKEAEATYTFTTTEQGYHVAVYEYVIDTANKDNVGVYSFCIISDKDYKDSEFIYWGNAEAGINIGQ